MTSLKAVIEFEEHYSNAVLIYIRSKLLIAFLLLKGCGMAKCSPRLFFGVATAGQPELKLNERVGSMPQMVFQPRLLIIGFLK